MRRTTAKSFWDKVDKSGDGGCWLWTMSLSEDEYGKCVFMGEQLAHRIAYRLSMGEIPAGQCVLHTCDVRHCINPDHLFLGTRVDNNADRDRKGRAAKGDQHGSRTMPDCRPRGERHSLAKLTDAQVIEIRDLYSNGNHTHRSLAKLFHVSHATIGDIIRFDTRKETP